MSEADGNELSITWVEASKVDIDWKFYVSAGLVPRWGNVNLFTLEGVLLVCQNPFQESIPDSRLAR